MIRLENLKVTNSIKTRFGSYRYKLVKGIILRNNKIVERNEWLYSYKFFL